MVIKGQIGLVLGSVGGESEEISEMVIMGSKG